MLTKQEINSLNQKIHHCSLSVVEKNDFIRSILKLDIEELNQLANEDILTLGFTMELGHYLDETECLRELLDELADHKVKNKTGYPSTHAVDLLEFYGKLIFFRLQDNEFLIGFYHEISSVNRNENYIYYGLEPA